ncbi:MAG: type II secretion system protein [Candidatus Omnitrophota bacterium]|nr:type II secretion system GspH family protein [Candidatus Omnitrophota bacterium]
MRKRGFTLLELVVVMIIMGILATLGFSQYTRVIERSRGAEARQVLGSIRTQAAGLWLERSGLIGGGTASAVVVGTFTNESLGIGTNKGQIPVNCLATSSSPEYYFSYAVTDDQSQYGFTAAATRCIVAGLASKSPAGPAALTLTLITNFSAGTDDWGGSGGY